MLRTYKLDGREFNNEDPWGEYLASVAWALCSTIHSTLKATPAQLVFGRDMILPIAFKANWEELRARRQKQITIDNERENSKRIAYDYKIGDKVILLDPISKKRKLSIVND